MRNFREKVEGAPLSPGVYIFKDRNSRPIYIGKAARLRERLRNYLTTKDPRILRMLSEAEELEWKTTATEKDAFFLENELIRRYQPRYNIRLKDDKSYPYLEITYGEDFPGIYIARRARRKGSLYFGPFVPASWARRVKGLVSILFGIRQCREKIEKGRERPCLDYYLGRCAAPCVGQISREGYRKKVEEAVKFLRGEVDEVREKLKEEMWKASQEMNFERAAYFRDLMLTVEEFSQAPKYSLSGSVDIFGFAYQGGKWALRVERIRGKRRESFSYQGEGIGPEPATAMAQFYQQHPEIPERIITGFTFVGWERLRDFLMEKYSSIPAIETPKGEEENFLATSVQREAEAMVEKERGEEVLQKVLGLSSVPYRIEAIDISHFSGKEVVGSVVVFEGGKPAKSLYRHYKLDERNDDFSNIKQVVKRRYEKHPLPDLLLIDGGRGQLSAALEALRELGLRCQVISLAKGEERIFIPERDLVLPEGDPARALLQRIRDEAHRFVITYHRRLRKKSEFSTVLEEVPGIGKKRLLSLLRNYKTLEEIRKAPLQELSSLVGKKAAVALKERLNENRD